MDLDKATFQKGIDESTELFQQLARRMMTNPELGKPEILLAIGLDFSERLISSTGFLISVQRGTPVKETQKMVAEEWIAMLQRFIEQELS